MERPLLQFLRVVATTVDTGMFYAAVVYLPLADVMSFYMAGPIYVAALSHLLLGENGGDCHAVGGEIVPRHCTMPLPFNRCLIRSNRGSARR